MVIHYTYGWTQQCVESFLDKTDRKLIVFDNNPLPGQYYKATRRDAGASPIWNRLCQLESEYVRSLDRVQVVKVPLSNPKRLPSHGKSLDFAFDWCQDQGYDSVLHIEPDSVVKGSSWIKQMEKELQSHWAIAKKPIMNRGVEKSIVVCLCPTMWRISEILDLGIGFSKQRHFNTGQKILKTCQTAGQLATIRTNEFKHFWQGTKKTHEDALRAWSFLL